jgi:spore coat polysaccharide biosynthesis protein SpsF
MKIGFFITARLKSTRLKKKILLDLEGQSVLGHVIERAIARNMAATISMAVQMMF